MIPMDIAEQLQVKTLSSDRLPSDANSQLIEQLKALLPNVINSDNQLDVTALQDIVDIANTSSNNKGYELTFAGKGLARAEADKPAAFELHVEQQQSKDFDNTNNVLIRGDNIEVLKVLYQNYHSKIKMIYIDPPYNTTSENFIYKDNFKQNDAQLIEQFGLDEDTSDFLHNVYGTRSHSGWLSFMYPRLKLARELLTDDGVIFISIDDNEQANLKILCDELFGEDNFVGEFIIQSTPNGMDYGHIAKQQEYVLFYSKKIEDVQSNLLLNKEKSFSYTDEIGQFNIHPLYNSNEAFHKANRPNLFYPFYLDRNLKDKNGFYQIFLEHKPNLIEIYPPLSQKNKTQFVWRWGKKLANENLNINIVGYKNNKGEFRVVEKMRHDRKLIRSIMTDTEISTRKGTAEVEAYFTNKVFSFPKPVSLIKRFLMIAANSNDLILDFFAGSGTTADAVMQLNAEDGGNRKYIMVQWDEAIDNKKNTEAYQFCVDNQLEPVISSITLERINRAGEKIKAELPSDKAMPDIGYKVFSLIPKPEIVQYQQPTQEGNFNLVSHRKNSLDTLYNMLSATCKPLDTPIQIIQQDTLYQADNEIYMLAEVSSEILETYNDLKVNIDGWAEISLENYLNMGVANRDNVTIVY